MVIGLPLLKPYLKSQFYKMNKPNETLIQKPLKCHVSKEKYESKILCSLLHHWLAFTAQQCEYLFVYKNFQSRGGGGKVI